MKKILDNNPSYKRGPIYKVCSGLNKTYKGYRWEKIKK